MYDNFEWYLGTLLILIYARGRFDRPKANRVSTTRMRFYGAATAQSARRYISAVRTACWAAFHLPDLLSALHIGAPGENPLGELKLSGPLIAALALTVLLPNFPVIAQIDERLLQFFEDARQHPD